MTPQEKELTIKAAVDLAGNVLFSAFYTCELKKKIESTVELVTQEGETKRFRILFELAEQ